MTDVRAGSRPPPRAGSRSPRRSQSRRRPLHERSDSQTNASNSPVGDDDDGRKSQPQFPSLDLFPRLPAHFLSPDPGSSIHIYEDDTASPTFAVHEAQPVEATPPPKLAQRRHRSAKGHQRKKTVPELRPLSLVEPSSSKSSRLLALPLPDEPKSAGGHASLVSLRRAQLEQLDAAAKREEQLRREQLSARPGTRSTRSLVRSGQSSPVEDQIHDTAFLDRYQALVLNHFQTDTTTPTPLTARDRPRSRGYLRDAARPRSQSSNQLPSSRPTSRPASRPVSRPVSHSGSRPTSRRLSQPTSPRPTSRRSRKDDFEASLVHDSPDGSPLEDFEPGEASALEAAPDRLRSVSQPPQLEHSADSMIEELLGDRVDLKYPIVQKPSVASMQSDSSSIRRAYPMPLRLSRKRADPALAHTAETYASAHAPSPLAVELTTPQGMTFSGSSSREASRTELPTPNTYQFDFDSVPDLSLSMAEHAHLSTYTDELADQLGELQPHGNLRHQHSFRHSMQPLRVPLSNQSSAQSLRNQLSCESLEQSRSRPGTANSQTSHRAFFTNFLNNSRVAWARAYYGGDERLHLEAPSVTQVDSTLSPEWGLRHGSGKYLGVQTPSRQTSNGSMVSPDSWTTITGHTSSPGSAGYAERIYIPRLRPMVQRDTSSTALSLPDTATARGWDDDDDEEQSSPAEHEAHPVQFGPLLPGPYSDSARTPSLHEASEARRQRPRSWHVPERYNLPQPIPPAVKPARFQRRSVPSHGGPGLGPFDPLHMPETPRLRPDRYTRNTLYSWRAPSLEAESQLSAANRQFWLLLLGFVFPVAWWIGAFLPIPPQPQPELVPDLEATRRQSTEAKLQGNWADYWDSEEIRRWQKGRRWRICNRAMSAVGVVVVAVVIGVAIWSALR